MNRSKTIRNEAERTELDDKIDHIMSAEDELIPSSGFLASVMERVQEEAVAPAPIPFPWKRTLPGILAIAGIFGWVGYDLGSTHFASSAVAFCLRGFLRASWLGGAGTGSDAALLAALASPSGPRRAALEPQPVEQRR
jgi:hypothetical protein